MRKWHTHLWKSLFTYSSIHSFNKHLLSHLPVPSSVLGIGITALTRRCSKAKWVIKHYCIKININTIEKKILNQLTEAWAKWIKNLKQISFCNTSTSLTLSFLAARTKCEKSGDRVIWFSLLNKKKENINILIKKLSVLFSKIHL